MFKWNKPTVQMLGRWQPWHKGHTELFKKALEKTGQVCIMVRSMPNLKIILLIFMKLQQELEIHCMMKDFFMVKNLLLLNYLIL